MSWEELAEKGFQGLSDYRRKKYRGKMAEEKSIG